MFNPSELTVQYVTNETGARTAVIVPIEEFAELLEDLHDLATMAERYTEATISHEDSVAELPRDGIL